MQRRALLAKGASPGFGCEKHLYDALACLGLRDRIRHGRAAAAELALV
jgi:hypothetical protein